MVVINELTDYMVHLKHEIWTELFLDIVACSAIFRSLNELEQIMVIRLAFMKQPISERHMRLWMQPNCETLVKKAMMNLRNKHLLIQKSLDKESSTKSSQPEVLQYLLNSQFQKSAQQLMQEGVLATKCSLLRGTNTEPGASVLDISRQQLEMHSRTQWDNLLRWMMSDNLELNHASEDSSFTVSTGSGIGELVDSEVPVQPCQDVIDLMIRKKLVSADVAAGGARTGMSREAFSWLLKDIRSQIVSLVVAFVMMLDSGALTEFCASTRDADETVTFPKNSVSETLISPHNCEAKTAVQVKDVLIMIMTLSQSAIGQSFSQSSLSDAQKRFISVAVDLGLLWVPADNHELYVVAPYSLLLAENSSETAHLAAAFSSIPAKTGRGPLSQEEAVKRLGLGDHYFHPALKTVESVVAGDAFRERSVSDSNKHTQKISVPSGTPHTSKNAALETGIVVQSNFKVYVYTASALQVSILSHLCELQSRTPNMVVGLLTRDSVLAAFKTGISADQIIRFLQSHAHPALHERNLKEGKPLVPENVVMQLRMWEQERQRLKLTSAVYFKKWDKQYLPELYQRSVRYAINKGILLYYTPWPDNNHLELYNEWLESEKYLAIVEDAKAETVQEIREIRNQIICQSSERREQS